MISISRHIGGGDIAASHTSAITCLLLKAGCTGELDRDLFLFANYLTVGYLRPVSILGAVELTAAVLTEAVTNDRISLKNKRNYGKLLVHEDYKYRSVGMWQCGSVETAKEQTIYIETRQMMIHDFASEDTADLHDIFGDDEAMDRIDMSMIFTDNGFGEFFYGKETNHELYSRKERTA